MKEYSIAQNMSLLSMVHKRDLDKIFRVEELIMGSYLHNCSDHDVSFDIGIGSLIIYWDNEDIKFRFIPSERFSKTISESIDGDSDVLAKALEQSLAKKVDMSYKDFL